MGERTVYGLLAWQQAMKLAKSVYLLTEDFPRREIFGLTAQLRRSAVSVPSNIAEGHGRLTQGEWRQFLGHARGSLLEMETQLRLARLLGFAAENVEPCLSLCAEVGRLINGLIAASKRAQSLTPNT